MLEGELWEPAGAECADAPRFLDVKSEQANIVWGVYGVV